MRGNSDKHGLADVESRFTCHISSRADTPLLIDDFDGGLDIYIVDFNRTSWSSELSLFSVLNFLSHLGSYCYCQSKMTRNSDIESASTGGQPAFEEPFAPGTVLLEDGKFSTFLVPITSSAGAEPSTDCDFVSSADCNWPWRWSPRLPAPALRRSERSTCMLTSFERLSFCSDLPP